MGSSVATAGALVIVGAWLVPVQRSAFFAGGAGAGLHLDAARLLLGFRVMFVVILVLSLAGAWTGVRALRTRTWQG